jgi:hypothetical protein
MLYWYKSIRHGMNIGIAADGFASRRRDTDDRNAAIDRLAVKLLGGARDVIERTALASYRCLDGRAEGLNFRVAPRLVAANARSPMSAATGQHAPSRSASFRAGIVPHGMHSARRPERRRATAAGQHWCSGDVL